MLRKISFLKFEFFRRFIRNVFRCPDLAVRMWIGGTHLRTFIFKDLHIMDEIFRAKFCGLLPPGLNHLFDGRVFKFGKSQVVARGEANDSAESPLGNGSKQRVVGIVRGRFLWQKRREVIIENKGGGIIQILYSPGSFVARTKITMRVVGRKMFSWSFFHLPQPGTSSAVRGNKHPLACKRIETTVRSIEDHFLVSISLLIISVTHVSVFRNLIPPRSVIISVDESADFRLFLQEK